MRMDDIKFKEEKEAWQRYLIRNPPNNSMVRMEMMNRAMNSELRAVMENYIVDQRGRLEIEEVEGFLEKIKQNAVIKISNEKHLANLEAVVQGAGERIMPFLSRIRAAAARVKITKHGHCIPRRHTQK